MLQRPVHWESVEIMCPLQHAAEKFPLHLYSAGGETNIYDAKSCFRMLESVSPADQSRSDLCFNECSCKNRSCKGVNGHLNNMVAGSTLSLRVDLHRSLAVNTCGPVGFSSLDARRLCVNEPSLQAERFPLISSFR